MSNLVVKIGGSLLYNDDLRVNELFLSKFKIWYEKYSKNFEKIVIVVGGGKLSRSIGSTVKGILPSNSVHSVSMEVTQLNAQVVKGYLNDPKAHIPLTISEATKYLDSAGRCVLITGGLKEGWSTDMDTVMFADYLHTDKVYKLSVIAGVYDEDPKTNSKAILYQNLTWDQIIKQFDLKEGQSHIPNKSAPITVETVFFAKKKNITMFVSGGESLYTQPLENVFESGTKISN